MSNLAAQYISQSYQSVINVGTGSGASLTSTLQPLTDGYGTLLPLSVSTTQIGIASGSLISGSLVPVGSGSFDLGTPTNPWRHAYFSSQSIYLDGHQILSLDTSNNTTLAAPSGSNDLRFINNITFDSTTTADIGSIITYVGRGANTQTQFNYSGSYHFHNTNGNLVFSNTTGPSDTTSSGSLTLQTKNGGNIGLHSENLIDVAAVYGDGNVNLNLRSAIDSPYDVYKQINLDEFALLLESNDGGPIRLHNNSGSIILDANQYVSGSPTGIQGGISFGSANISLSENDGGGNALGIMKLYGSSPSVYLQQNQQGSGSQYPTYNVLFDSGSYPADIYAGFQVYDPNTFYAGIALAANSYTSQYPGQAVGYVGGGGQYNGSDAAILLPASNPVVEFVKPIQADAGVTISGSLNVSGSEVVSGSIQIRKSDGGNGLEIYNSGIYSDGTIISRNSVVVAATNPNLSLQSNLEGSGSAYSVASLYVDSATDPANVFSGIVVFPTTGSAKEIDLAISSYSPEYGGTPVGMIIAGGNNTDGSNTAIAFPNDGSMQVFKNTNFNYNTSVAGYSKSTLGYTQVKMSSGQTITAGSDVVVNFDNVVINNNGWFNSTGHTFQPPVAGTYEISFVVQVGTGTGNGQMNAQVRKNGSTQLLIVQDEVNKNVNHSLVGSVLVDMNGSTDYVEITFYTSSNSGSQVVQDNNGSFFKAVLL